MYFYIIIQEYMVKKKMDENSCEGETSKSVENVVNDQKTMEAENVSELENMGIRTALKGKSIKNQVSDRCGSSRDASVSGPSTDVSLFKFEDNDAEENEPTAVDEPENAPFEESAQAPEVASTPCEENEAVSVPWADQLGQVERPTDRSVPPNYEERQDIQPQVRLAPCVEEQVSSKKPSVGPPPSYSFVMKQKKKLKSLPSSDLLVTDRPLPPTYPGSRGLYITPDENRLERICNFPSFAEPIWRSHSQPALCPRCGIIVLTTTHSHDSIATHVAALALCLFGCWPCCLLPYCMKVCKNTYHHCPICQAFLGLYTPW